MSLKTSSNPTFPKSAISYFIWRSNNIFILRVQFYTAKELLLSWLEICEFYYGVYVSFFVPPKFAFYRAISW